jgi:hypothetical protein
VRDFVLWEPGLSLICVLCEHERGGADPPGPWFRHNSLRRIPIFHADLPGPLGYLEYIWL